MSGKLIDRIPTLALSDFLEGGEELQNKFVKDLGFAFESIGFVAIKDHGYSAENQSSLYDSIKEFYELAV
jgi:Isopenicillin N synthase and related dioxygenases